MSPNVGKTFTNSPSTLTFCLYKKWLIFTERSRMLRTNYRCVQSHNISVDVAKCGQNFHGMTVHQLIMMSLYAKNKLQMSSVTQHQCRRRQMWGKLSQIHQGQFLFDCHKNAFSWLNNLRFQLIMMSSYAKNKLQMCSVTQHQCRCRQMWAKLSQIHPVSSLFEKMSDLYWTIYLWYGFNSLWCFGMQRTNYGCVQSITHSVDVAKFWENIHKFTQYFHILFVIKNDLSWLTH